MGSEKRAPSEQRKDNLEWAQCLFEDHEDFIRSVIRFVIRNPSEEDDFFQDLFLYFVLKSHPDHVRKIRGFLYRVIQDRAIDWHRRRTRHRQKLRQLMEHAERTGDPEGTEAVFLRNEEANQLYDQIQQYLSKNQAKAILYRYKHEYSLDETAKKMGLQPQTISRYISVGLKKFRALINEKERAEKP